MINELIPQGLKDLANIALISLASAVGLEATGINPPPEILSAGLGLLTTWLIQRNNRREQFKVEEDDSMLVTAVKENANSAVDKGCLKAPLLVIAGLAFAPAVNTYGTALIDLIATQIGN